MIKVTYDGKVAMAYHHLLHDVTQGSYKPNPYWDDYTSNLMGLLLTNLPRNSTNKTLTDIGSGAGKWSALLSPYFDQIVSIEPNDDLRQKQANLLERLKIENVDMYPDAMPACIKKLNCQAALLAESLYLTEDWLRVYRLLLEDDQLQWLAIADGPDGDITDDSGWHTPYGSISNRMPLVKGDEWRMFDIAQEHGWAARLFDIHKDEPMSDFNDSADRWLLILER